MLWVGLDPVALDAAAEPGAVRTELDAQPVLDGFDAVVLGPTKGALEDGLPALRARLRPGGMFALVVATTRTGLGGAVQRALAAFDPSLRPRPLEDVCGALLTLGCSTLAVIPLPGLRGDVLVHGRLPGP